MYRPKTASPNVGPWRIWIDEGPTLWGSTALLKVNFRTRLSGTLSWPDCSKSTRTRPGIVSPEPEPPAPPPQPARPRAPPTAAKRTKRGMDRLNDMARGWLLGTAWVIRPLGRLLGG